MHVGEARRSLPCTVLNTAQTWPPSMTFRTMQPDLTIKAFLIRPRGLLFRPAQCNVSCSPYKHARMTCRSAPLPCVFPDRKSARHAWTILPETGENGENMLNLFWTGPGDSPDRHDKGGSMQTHTECI